MAIEIPEFLREEVEPFIRQQGKDPWILEYLNNWHFRLLDHEYPNGYCYYLAEHLGRLDILHIDLGYRGEDHSDTFNRQTPRQLAQVVQASLTLKELSNGRIIGLQRQIREDRRLDARIELFEYTLPAYVFLREEGYNRQDLTG